MERDRVFFTTLLEENVGGYAHKFFGHEDIEEIVSGLEAGTDFAHTGPHGLLVASYVLSCISEKERTETLIKTVALAGIYHDKGRALEKVFPDIPHEYLSLFTLSYAVSSMPTDVDLDLLKQLIVNHNKDVLPSDSPYIVRLFRDADRVAGFGPFQWLRSAYYMGFRHPVFDGKDDKELVESFVYDLSDPLEEDHEMDIYDFVIDEVFPYMEATGQLQDLMEDYTLWLDRILGKKEGDKQIIDAVSRDMLSLCAQKLLKAELLFLVASLRSGNEPDHAIRQLAGTRERYSTLLGIPSMKLDRSKA